MPQRTAVAPSRPIGGAGRGDNGKIDDLNNQLLELKVNMEGLEKERDFYFGKLRDIEVMCQETDEGNPLIQKILDVLYATEVNLAYILPINSNKHIINYDFRMDLLRQKKPTTERARRTSTRHTLLSPTTNQTHRIIITTHTPHTHTHTRQTKQPIIFLSNLASALLVCSFAIAKEKKKRCDVRNNRYTFVSSFDNLNYLYMRQL